jgi:hypothetical protein
MKLRTHTCAATGCQHVISTRMLMCLDHWRMVPAPLRREVLGRRQDLRQAAPKRPQITQEEMEENQAALDAYWDTVARAVAAVEEKQERKAAGPSGSLFT